MFVNEMMEHITVNIFFQYNVLRDDFNIIVKTVEFIIPDES